MIGMIVLMSLVFLYALIVSIVTSYKAKISPDVALGLFGAFFAIALWMAVGFIQTERVSRMNKAVLTKNFKYVVVETVRNGIVTSKMTNVEYITNKTGGSK